VILISLAKYFVLCLITPAYDIKYIQVESSQISVAVSSEAMLIN